jgi:PAS domain S-box-containing protein
MEAREASGPGRLGGPWSGETDRIFEHSLNPAFLIDDERRYVDANEAACSFLGLSRDQVVGRRFDEFLVPDLRAIIEEAWPEFLALGRRAGFFSLQMPDGSVRETMYSSIANVTTGRHLTVYLLEDAPERAAGNGAARAGSSLSPRQREVLELVADGKTSTDIAERLVVSPETVRTHLRNARLKLGASTKAQAVAIAMVRGEIKPTEPQPPA